MPIDHKQTTAGVPNTPSSSGESQPGMTPIIRAAHDLANRAHTGQLCDFSPGVPYMAHCISVGGYLADHGFYEDKTVLAAGYLHDVLARGEGVQFEEIAAATSVPVADIVLAFTGSLSDIELRLRNYARIAPSLADCPGAIPIKIADRLANVNACWRSKNSTLFTYYEAHRVFRASVTGPLARYPEMAARCATLLAALDTALCWGGER